MSADGATSNVETTVAEQAPAAASRSWKEVGKTRREKLASPFVELKRRAEGFLHGAGKAAEHTIDFGLALTSKEGRQSIGADIKAAANGAGEAIKQGTQEAIEASKRKIAETRESLAKSYSENVYWSKNNAEKRRQAAEQRATIAAIGEIREAMREGVEMLRQLEAQKQEIAAIMQAQRQKLETLLKKVDDKSGLRTELLAGLSEAQGDTPPPAPATV